MFRGVVVMTLMQLDEEEDDDEDADEEAEHPTDHRPVNGHCCVMLEMGDGLLLAVVLVVAQTSNPDGLL